MIRRALIVTVVLMLGACGFQPMYGGGEGQALRRELSGVTVAPIPERIGQLVRNNLLENLSSGDGASPQYRLAVKLNLEEEGVGFRQDEAITRTNLRLEAAYRLVDLTDQSVALNGEARVFGAYDVVQSDFSSLVARRDTERNLADQLAAQIHTRLAAHFREETGDEAQAARH